MRKCNTCGGTYEPIQNDMQYFHACPDVFNKTTKQTEKTKDYRDENVVATIDDSGNEPKTITTIKSEGKGYTEL